MVSILRAIAGIVVGYIVFAAASMLLVAPVMAREGALVPVLALVALALIGAVAGLLATTISGSHRRLVVAILACLVALATLANLLMGFGAEPVWYKVGTLVLTTSAILLVGLLRSRRA